MRPQDAAASLRASGRERTGGSEFDSTIEGPGFRAWPLDRCGGRSLRRTRPANRKAPATRSASRSHSRTPRPPPTAVH